MSKTRPRMRKTVDLLFEEQDLVVEDVAAQTGLDEKRVEAIALGRWTPSPNERKRMAEALGVDMADIDWGHTLDPRNIRYRRFGLEENFNDGNR